VLMLLLACLVTDAESRFVNEYKHEARELKQEFTQARGVATTYSVVNGKLGTPTTFQFATGSGRRKFEFEKIVQMAPRKSSVNRYGYAELDGRNIEVQRTGPSEPYKVRGIGDDDAKRRSFFDAIFGNYLNAPWGVGGHDIEDSLARGWFAVTEAQEVEVQGREQVKVTFRLTTMTEPHYYQAVFDPTLHWAITKASKWTADPMKPSERYEVTYGPTVSGHTYIKSLHWWGRDGKEKLCEFDPVEFAPTAASEFTLEHYLLKSPPLPDKQPNYLIVAGIFLLAIALLFLAWFAHRLAARRS